MASSDILIDDADARTWSGYSSLEENLRQYLQSHGWLEQPSGRTASLWYSSVESDEASSLIVPSVVVPGSFEWKSVVKRLAAYEHKAVDDIVVSIATHYVD